MPDEKKPRKSASAGHIPTPARDERLANATKGSFDRAMASAGVLFDSPLVQEAHARNAFAMAYGSERSTGSPAERMMIATSQINPLIARAEEAIRALGFHVTASVMIDYDEDSSRHLRFGKEGRDWCLTVESGLNNDPERWTSARLHTASRETRLKALELLPKLLDELSGIAEQQALAAQKIIDDAAAFIDSLERTHQ
jgi:hypothetical protein